MNQKHIAHDYTWPEPQHTWQTLCRLRLGGHSVTNSSKFVVSTVPRCVLTSPLKLLLFVWFVFWLMMTIIAGDFARSWLSLPLSNSTKVKGGTNPALVVSLSRNHQKLNFKDRWSPPGNGNITMWVIHHSSCFAQHSNVFVCIYIY